MGLLQPHVRYGGGTGVARLSQFGKAITIYSLAHATLALKAASETERPVLLLSAPFAAGAAGPGWFGSVVDQATSAFPETDVSAMLDCGDLPGYAMAALRQGLKNIRFDGDTFEKISDIAQQLGATIAAERPDSLDLYALELDGKRLEIACRDWLLDEV